MNGRQPAKEQRYIQSIEIGFRLIDVLRKSAHKMPLKEIAHQAGMTPTKAHLYLAAFIRIGFVSQDPGTSRYGLGAEAVHLGLAAIEQLDIVSASSTVMDDLFEQFGVSVCLAIWGDVGPTIVRKLDPKQAMPNTLRVGSSLPLLWSSTGNVFLAFGSGQPLAEILDREVAERKDFKQRAAEIRASLGRQGFSWTESRMNQGYAALSAPIFDYENRITAALTFVALAPQIDRDPRHVMVKALLSGAQRISQRMCQLDAGPPDQRGMQLVDRRRPTIRRR